MSEPSEAIAKPKSALKKKRNKGALSKLPEAPQELQFPPIDIKVLPDALAELAEAEREEVVRESKRAALAAEIAKHRWTIAQHFHRLEDGRSKLDFQTRPFLVDIYQDDGIDTVLLGSTQFGKSLPKYAKVLTPDGWRLMGDLVVGDKVSTPDGGSANIVGVYPQGVLPVYKVTFGDGRTAEACGQHLWEVFSTRYGRPHILNTLSIRELLKDDKTMYVERAKQGPANADTTFNSIELEGNADCQCIAIDSPRKLFISDDYVVSHNTEVLICHAVASAGVCGMKILWVCSKQDKRNRFVAARIDPAFNSVPMYKELFQVARARSATADSTGLKHFGSGCIFFIYASAEREFTSWAADQYIVDEHQECEQSHLAMLPDRLTGSPWGFTYNVGHPSMPGSPTNPNLDYLYSQSDQRKWYVPCPTCGVEQELSWGTHVVYEKKNDHGAILSVVPRDEEYRPGVNAMDMRPICENCHRPMNRLSRMGKWIKQRPDMAPHGFRISNLYNANVRLDTLFKRYVGARHNPALMQEFYNKQLGICYSMTGTKIDDTMLAACALGDETGLPPYRFVPVTQMGWRQIVKETSEVEL